MVQRTDHRGLPLVASCIACSIRSVLTPSDVAGFGLGALNDAEDDDVDIYASGYGPSGRQRRLAYDDDEDEGERVILGKRRGLGRDNAKPEVSTLLHPHVRVSQLRYHQSQASHVSSTFHDGRLVLRGYVLGDKPVIEDKWYVWLSSE